MFLEMGLYKRKVRVYNETEAIDRMSYATEANVDDQRMLGGRFCAKWPQSSVRPKCLCDISASTKFSSVLEALAIASGISA